MLGTGENEPTYGFEAPAAQPSPVPGLIGLPEPSIGPSGPIIPGGLPNNLDQNDVCLPGIPDNADG